jgi:hypothetical protein
MSPKAKRRDSIIKKKTAPAHLKKDVEHSEQQIKIPQEVTQKQIATKSKIE